MKQWIIIIITLLCICLYACGTYSSKDVVNSIQDNNSFECDLNTGYTDESESKIYSNILMNYPLEYESISDLREAVNRKNGADIYKEFSEQGVTSEQLEKITLFIEKLSSQNNAVPYLDGKMIELRNKEGYTNISLFASEAYGLPCIFYHPSVSTGENYYIKITYLPDEIAGQNDKTVSEIIKELSPNAPNLGNLGNQHNNIYEQTITLADREVTALVYEYKNDSRNSTIFVYDDVIVEIRSNPNEWTKQLFLGLSFGALNDN